MGFFDDLKRSMTDVVSGLTTQVERYKNKDVLEAFIAASAYIASADGHISSEEKRKVVTFVRNTDLLKSYDTNEAIKIFEKYAEQFSFDYEIGKAETLRVIGKHRNNPDVGRMIIRVAIVIGNSDGTFDDDEKRAAREIALELGQNPADFDLVAPDNVPGNRPPNRITLGGNRN